MKFELLEFDTKLFGFKVAKIVTPKLSRIKLRALLDQLRQQNVRLVYWPTDSTDQQSQQAAKTFQGFLSSNQVTYLISLQKLPLLPATAAKIKRYQAKKPTAAMKQLALQIGIKSRFAIDPKLKPLLHKLYYAWIKNSVNGSVAARVLVTRHKNQVIGMITLGEKNGRGDIGLLAVDPNFRGNSLGTKLVAAAQNYFIKKGCSEAQVVTQKTNLPACHLYEKSGFHQEKIENFYHFWL